MRCSAKKARVVPRLASCISWCKVLLIQIVMKRSSSDFCRGPFSATKLVSEMKRAGCGELESLFDRSDRDFIATV